MGGEDEGHPTFAPNVIYIIAVGCMLLTGQDGFGLVFTPSTVRGDESHVERAHPVSRPAWLYVASP